MSQHLPGKIRVLGLMSGTSLDGLDLALCEFERLDHKYSFSILAATTKAYDPSWKTRLQNAHKGSAEDYLALNALYGRFLADQVNAFIGQGSKPAAVASHGHTVFHQPHRGFSAQIGCGATIAARTGIATICDFRNVDVANGGQGAPLVPVGDQLLFPGYEACLNIGGIANISFTTLAGARTAYDICEANMLLNHLAEKAGKAYDENGALARSGHCDEKLLSQLNAPDYYRSEGAKSMGREWFEKNAAAIVNVSLLGVNDLLATATEHVAGIIAADLSDKRLKNVLVTGGGAFNSFLIERIRSKTKCELVLPDAQTINFKEALIFAFLGYLRLSGQNNALKTVTGACRDSIGGALYLG